MGGRRRAEASSKTLARVDWCTPEDVLACVRECGPIALDPCTNEHSIAQAERAFQYQEGFHGELVRGVERVVPGNGLTDPWSTKLREGGDGSVYVNHPFSADPVVCWDGKTRRTNEAWARRAAHQARYCPGGIFMLTPANPCSMWWRWYWDHASLVCFWDGRLQFLGAPFTADFEIALVYFGDPSTTVLNALRARGRTVRVRDTHYAGKRERETP